MFILYRGTSCSQYLIRNIGETQCSMLSMCKLRIIYEIIFPFRNKSDLELRAFCIYPNMMRRPFRFLENYIAAVSKWSTPQRKRERCLWFPILQPR